ncbi:MAG: nitroreductase family protein [Candidatus Nanoarchaeia archaeon]
MTDKTAEKISLEKAKQNKLFYVVANVVIFRESDGKCLILKRSEREVAHPNKYGVPGGKLEWNDLDINKPTRVNGAVLDYEDAIEKLLIRETKEEAGIEIHEDFKYINSIAFIRPDEVPVILVKLAAKYKSGEVALEEGSFTDYAWVNEKEVDKYECIKGIPEEIKKTIKLFTNSNQTSTQEFKEIVEQRYAVKKFDGRIIPEEKVEELLEIIRLSASSLNTQPWKVKIIKDKKTKELLLPASRDQPQVTTCSHLLIFCADLDYDEKIIKLEKEMRSKKIPEENMNKQLGMIKTYAGRMSDSEKLNWAKCQIHIAVGNTINGAKSLGFDSCPMGGFEPDKYSEILKLPKHLVPAIIVPIGYPASDNIKRPKVRLPKEDIFF